MMAIQKCNHILQKSLGTRSSRGNYFHMGWVKTRTKSNCQCRTRKDKASSDLLWEKYVRPGSAISFRVKYDLSQKPVQKK